MPCAPTALTEYGWIREEGRLSIVWEAPENIRKAKAKLEFVLSGCRCKQAVQPLDVVVKSKGDTVDLDATALIVPMGLTFHPRE